jgi:TRAP-type uncharacterized transport system substrate-binding protein
MEESMKLKVLWVKLAPLAVSFSFVSMANAADNLGKYTPNPSQAARVTIGVACGGLDKTNCKVVVPTISTFTTPQGVDLNPFQSRGSVHSMEALCGSDAPIGGAIVQLDSAIDVIQKKNCGPKVKQVGKPIYPYYAFLIVKKEMKEDYLREMANAAKQNGSAWRIAAGEDGSGGVTTFTNLLEHQDLWNPGGYPNAFQFVPGVSDEEALASLDNNTIDGFFILDGRTSTKVQQILQKQKYKVIDIRLDQKFYDSPLLVDKRTRQPIYSEALVKSGVFRNRYTISVDSILVMRTSDASQRTAAGKLVSNVLAESIELAFPELQKPDQLNIDPDWKR